MAGQGLRVLRFTNEEVITNTDEVLMRIAKFLVKSDLDAAFKNKKGTRSQALPLPLPEGGDIN